MLLTTPDALMLSTSAVSAGCCVAPPARASAEARLLALAMVAAMTVVTLAPTVATELLAGVELLAVAISMLLLQHPLTEVSLHRAIGAVLMAAAILVHLHATSATMSGMAGMHGMVGMPGMGYMATGSGPAATGSEDWLGRALMVSTAIYLLWTVVGVVRMWARPLRHLPRWEHLAMGISLAVMVYGMDVGH